jgi:hypothetical protein
VVIAARSRALLFLAATTLAACGGRVVFDGEGAGGSTGSSSSSASGSSSVSSSSSASSSSTVSSSSGNPDTCPVPFPGIEASCPTEGQICQVPLACCAGTALCKGGFWHYTGQVCQELCGPVCGPDNFTCLPDVACVTYLGKTTTYQCRKAPCGPELLCSCAEPLCEEQAMKCNNIQDGFKVLCDCQGNC